jgi:MFS superfamily sulfate permease-like transporter
MRRDSFIFGLLALAGVLILGILPGLLVTAGLSVILLIGMQSRPSTSILGRLPGTPAYLSVANHPEAETIPGLMLFRLDAPLMFINANWMRDALREQVAAQPVRPEVVVIDLEGSHDLDIKGIDTIARLDDELRDQGVELWLAGIRTLSRVMLDRAVMNGSLRPVPTYQTVNQAVDAFTERHRPSAADSIGA